MTKKTETKETSNVDTTIAQLINRRKKWEQGELLASNKVLYSILADCLTLVEVVSKNRVDQKKLSETLVEMKIGFNKSTPLTTKVVKVVFGVDRQRAYVYSMALRAARKAKITPDQLSNWLTGKGGVEEVRLDAANPGRETPTQRSKRHAEAGEEIVNERNKLATVKKFKETPEEVGPVVLIAYVNPDGTTDLKSFVSDKTVVDMALAVIGKETEEEDADANASSVSVERTAAIKAAAESVVYSGDEAEQAAA
jgi:hypothetical protein